MKAVIQRVEEASVTVDSVLKGSIKNGLLVYLGVSHNDTEKDADKLAEKIVNLRIFNDDRGVMNLSFLDIQNTVPESGVLAVSQFTLLADIRKGRRPSWNNAASPEKAKELYEYFIKQVKKQGALLCESGEFRAHMKVTYTNDGPVTIIADTEDLS